MGHRVCQIAQALGINSKDIVRKLTAEELPPSPKDRDKEGQQRPWTHRSPVSVGLEEVIREWFAAGELKAVPEIEAAEPGASRKVRKTPRRRIEMETPAGSDTATGVDSPAAPDEGLAHQALEAVAQINREAEQKKQDQVEALLQSRDTVLGNLEDLNAELAEIDKALAIISGHAAGARTKGNRRDLAEVRERMGMWLEARRGEKFKAGDLGREFPELEGTAVSYVLKPLVGAGRVQTDTTEGVKRPQYFAPAGAATGA